MKSEKKLQRMQKAAASRAKRAKLRTGLAIGAVANYGAAGFIGDRIARDEQTDPTKLTMTIAGRDLPRYEAMGGAAALAGIFVKSLGDTTRMLLIGGGGGVAAAQRAVRAYQYRIEHPLP